MPRDPFHDPNAKHDEGERPLNQRQDSIRPNALSIPHNISARMQASHVTLLPFPEDISPSPRALSSPPANHTESFSMLIAQVRLW